MSHRQSAHGFTLLEIILATTTAAMLALALYTSMNVAMKARRSAQGVTAPMREASIVLDAIARDLRSTPPPRGGVLSGPLMGTASGSDGARSDTLNFYTLDGRDTAEGGVGEHRQIEFAVGSDETGPVLVRRMKRNILESETQTPAEQVLCRGVVSFGLRYHDGQEWADSWDSTAQGDILPQAVEVTLVLSPSNTAAAAQTRPLTVTRVVPMACAPSAEQLQAGSAG